MFILDEADEMLSRGFKDQIYDIFREMPEDVQVCIYKFVLILYFLSTIIQLFILESSTLPLSHCAPIFIDKLECI